MKDYNISRSLVVTYIILGILWVSGTMFFIFQLFSNQSLNSFISLIGIISDLLIAIIGISVMRKRVDWFIFISFLIISYISTCYFNNLSLLFWINGMRYYFPLLFLLPIYRYLTRTPEIRDRTIELFEKTLFWFFVIQTPCLIYQLMVHGAGDWGGGSLGNKNSGPISMLLFLLSYYFMKRRWDYSLSYLQNMKRNWVLIVLTFGAFTNETKISFILIVLYFIFLVPYTKGMIKNLIAAFVVLIAFMGVGGYLYIKLVESGDSIFNKEYMEAYMMGNDVIQEQFLEYYIENEQGDDQTADFARGLKFVALPLVIVDKPWTPWWGFGIGQFKGGTFIEKSNFAKRYDFLVSGTQMMGMIWLLDFGFIGFTWAIVWMLVLFQTFVPKRKKSVDKMMLVYYVLYMIMIVLYAPNFTVLPFSIIYLWLCFLATRWDWTKNMEPYYPVDKGNLTT